MDAKMIGPYRIEGEIGRGGMGVVFKAVHDTLERTAAVKVLPAEFAGNPEYVSRFLREARTVATLRHEHIVEVYDAGEQDGKYYIAMEFVEGLSLGAYLKEKGTLPEKEGLELLHQAAKGLAAAHAKGLVHRDIKPDNMLLDKTRTTLRLVDFGLVRDSASNSQLTATGACLGTPQYMSPEQADGESADPRTDIYSLGVSFYRAMTGKAPFESNTVMNLLFKHKFEAPPDPRVLNNKLSKPAANLILTMLAKTPGNRPPSADALLELIEKVQKGKKIPEPTPFETPTLDGINAVSDSSSGSQGFSKRPLAIAGGALGLIVILGGIGALIILRGAESDTAQEGKTNGSPTSTPETASQKDPSPKGPSTDPLLTGNQKGESGNGTPGKTVTGTESGGIASPLNGRKVNPSNFSMASQEAGKLADKAEATLLAGNTTEAATLFETAAAMAGNEITREQYAAKARDCRYREQVKIGQVAEIKRDWVAALQAYRRATEYKTSPLLSDKLAEIGKKAEQEKQFSKTYALGKQQLDRGLALLKSGSNPNPNPNPNPNLGAAKQILQDARNSFSAVRPWGEANREADFNAKMQLLEGCEQFLRAWETEERLDYPAAIASYKLVERSHADLQGPALARRMALEQKRRSSADSIWTSVQALALANRIDEARQKVAAALRSNPGHRELMAIQSGLDELKSAVTGFQGLRGILRQARQTATQAIAANRNDDYAARIRDQAGTWDLQCTQNEHSAKNHFSQKQFNLVTADAAGARTLAGQVSSKMRHAAQKYEERASLYRGKKLELKGIFSVKVKKGDEAKARRLSRTAETFSNLERQADRLK